ncbi:MAG: translesion error-prone DNA polymerase V autoproteolytic subunit [Armatimonadetes bacterium]|nr:translesion error-prone DNA polymerase V autoproteolytic subunit [Armatimonadota bacterium]MDW8120684.1 translesion error-prone DNA polymerase V autoproteolytic subunit [Armatimonadota bacterium]
MTGTTEKGWLARWKVAPGGQKLPLLGVVAAGWPSPAEEELVDILSLDDLLIENREATFLVRVTGDSMVGAGILPGDMVLVDTSQVPKSGDIVIAQVDGEWTMKYLIRRGQQAYLMGANSHQPVIRPKSELKIAGVVTAVIRKYK